MTAPLNPQTNVDSSIDVRLLALTFLRGWRIILACLLTSLLVAIIHLHFVTYLYAVVMRVTPVQASGNDSSPARLGSLNSLATLAGVSMPTGTNASQFRLYVESMHSRDLANDIAQDTRIMKRLYAGEWDEATQSWRQPSQRLSLSNILGAILGMPKSAWQPPDGARVAQFLDRNIVIVEDIKKPYLVQISFVTANPKFGVELLSALNRAADNRLRRKALVRAEQYVSYLSNKLNTVTIAEQRAAIMQTLSAQEQFVMMANSAAPFSAELFDAPAASPSPIAPNPSRILLISIMAGLAAGLALVFAIAHYGAMVNEILLAQDQKYHLQSRLPRFLVFWHPR